jgi:SAM-dependent methyltransferase
MNLDDYVTLWRLAKHRLDSETDYRQFQIFQSELLSKYLRGFGIEIQGALVLDLGSGIGGYSVEMVKRRARVISMDLAEPTYVSERGHTAVIADALAIPLQTECIDFVFCASLIEHVNNPARLLKEIERVLGKGGRCYLSFPPFWSPIGGHEYSPFHYLGERWALRLVRGRTRLPGWTSTVYRVSPDPRSFSATYEDWGLFRMTIAKARGLIASTELRIVDMSTRYLPISAIRWPLLGEFLTWHAQFLLQKPA